MKLNYCFDTFFKIYSLSLPDEGGRNVIYLLRIFEFFIEN